METDVKQESNNLPGRAFRARWILPLSAPPIEDGVIVLKGDRIQLIGHFDRLRDDLPENLIDLGDAVIFPAFVNVHTHLEDDILEELPGNVFHYLRQSRAALNDRSAEEQKALVYQNITDCARTGTIALGDFFNTDHSTEGLEGARVFARVFHELRGFKNYEADYIIRQVQARMEQTVSQRQLTHHLGMSSPWQLSPELFRMISIRERHVAIHMAMTEAETEFMHSGKGPVKQYLLSIGDFDYSWEAPKVSPVQYFFNNRFYARHNILIHMNEVSETDIDVIKNSPAKVNVCLCPRASQTLQLRPTPVKRILEKGINICMGTESKALAGDLDMRKELRTAVDLYGVSPDTALKFATLNGAYAIGFHKEVGSLETGKTARCLVAWATGGPSNDPFEMILDDSRELVWLDNYDEQHT